VKTSTTRQGTGTHRPPCPISTTQPGDWSIWTQHQRLRQFQHPSSTSLGYRKGVPKFGSGGPMPSRHPWEKNFHAQTGVWPIPSNPQPCSISISFRDRDGVPKFGVLKLLLGAIVGVQKGFFQYPMYNVLVNSDLSSNCFVFEKIASIHIWRQTDRPTDQHTADANA